VQQVAQVIERVMVAGNPRARYLVGRDARAAIWFSRLPTRLRDRLIARQLPAYGNDV
jgi:hypothetical protein